MVVMLGLTLGAGVQTGCVALAAGAAVGAGTVAYLRGQLEAGLGNSYDDVVRATDRALDSLRFSQRTESRDDLASVFEARTADDKKVVVRVVRSGDRLTTVKIRVGIVGNESISQIILERIKERL